MKSAKKARAFVFQVPNFIKQLRVDAILGHGQLRMIHIGAIQIRGFPRFVEKSKNPPFQPKVEIPFPVVAGEVEYITIEAKHRGRGRCFHRAMNFLDCLGKRIFYGGHS